MHLQNIWQFPYLCSFPCRQCLAEGLCILPVETHIETRKSCHQMHTRISEGNLCIPEYILCLCLVPLLKTLWGRRMREGKNKKKWCERLNYLFIVFAKWQTIVCKTFQVQFPSSQIKLEEMPHWNNKETILILIWLLVFWQCSLKTGTQASSYLLQIGGTWTSWLKTKFTPKASLLF